MFKGIFRCGVCGSLITGEIQTGANNSGVYEYYKCANPKCKKHYVSGKKINEKIINLFETIRIKPEYVEPIKKGLLELHKVRKNEENEKLVNIHSQLRETKNKLDTLTEKLLENVISNDVYKMKQSELMARRIRLEEKAKDLQKNSDKFSEYAENIIELCKNAYSHYLRADNENKRLLLKILCSNFLYDGENVVIKLKSTVEPMLLGANFLKSGE